MKACCIQTRTTPDTHNLIPKTRPAHYNLPVSSESDNKHRARVAESIGLALIALLILIITLARYGGAARWSLR